MWGCLISAYCLLLTVYELGPRTNATDSHAYTSIAVPKLKTLIPHIALLCTVYIQPVTNLCVLRLLCKPVEHAPTLFFIQIDHPPPTQLHSISCPDIVAHNVDMPRYKYCATVSTSFTLKQFRSSLLLDCGGFESCSGSASIYLPQSKNCLSTSNQKHDYIVVRGKQLFLTS